MIRSSSAEFDHINVVTALGKVLQAPRRGVPPEVVMKALKRIEESALQKMQDFGPQQTANTLHIMANCDNRDKAGGADDGAAGGAGGGMAKQ